MRRGQRGEVPRGEKGVFSCEKGKNDIRTIPAKWEKNLLIFFAFSGEKSEDCWCMKFPLFSSASGSASHDAPQAQVPVVTSSDSDDHRLEMDIFETRGAFFFLCPLMGMDMDKTQVHIGEDVLTISSCRDFPEEVFEDEKNAFLHECKWGKFSRSVVLPTAVNSENATASVSNGILVVRIPKVQKVQSKHLKISVS